MDAELRIIRLGKAAKLWIVVLYTAAELQFVRLLKVKHKRKLRLFIITLKDNGFRMFNETPPRWIYW